MKRFLIKPGNWFTSTTGKSTTGALDLNKVMSGIGFYTTFTTSDWVAQSGLSTITFDSSSKCLNCVEDAAIVQLRDSNGNLVTVDELIFSNKSVTIQVVSGDEFDGSIVIK